MMSMLESTLLPLVTKINSYLSNYVLIFLLLAVGIWYTVKTRFVQIRCFKEGWNRVFGNLTMHGEKGSGMSSFQALATAIAAQVGTGIIVGVFLVAICAFIFLGGVQRLASVTEKLVPIMAAIFLVGGLIVLIARIKYLPETIAMIFRYAFTPHAIIGGSFGYAIKEAISQGVKRGLFSNEAGMGSTPHAHALAEVSCPHEQGTVAMIGVFIDMFIILTLNALVIISTLYAGDGPLAGCGAAAASTVFNKTNLAQNAFGTIFGESLGNMFVAVCLFFFAFSTILSWNLFGKKSVIVYTLLSLACILLGTTMSNDLVWELSDLLNQLMVIPNVAALFALTNMVVKHANADHRLPNRK